MDLLYGNQRKALKFLYKSYKKDISVTKVILSKHLNLNFQETSQVCKELYNKGFILHVGINYNPKINSNGIEYFSMVRSERIKTLLNSILFPITVSIIVSIITSLLTWWLTGLSQ